MSEPKSATGCRLSEIMGISHDRVNRLLLRESDEPKDWFHEAQSAWNLVGGTASVDDSVLDQPYRQHLELVSHLGSGKPHWLVKG